jgi:hypothetical protein
MFTKPLNDQFIKRMFEAFKIMILISITGATCSAQENPWATKKNGPNPWGTSEEVKKENKLTPIDSSTVQIKADTTRTETVVLIVKEPETIEVAHETDMVYLEKFKSYFYKVPNSSFYAYSDNIQDTIFLSTDDGKILILDRRSNSELEHLENYAKTQFKAPGAFVGSFLCSAFLNVFSIPFNLISLAVPSYGKERFTNDFLRDNKGARASERKSIRKGIQKKRTQNTGAGTLSGILLSTILWFNIFN